MESSYLLIVYICCSTIMALDMSNNITDIGKMEYNTTQCRTKLQNNRVTFLTSELPKNMTPFNLVERIIGNTNADVRNVLALSRMKFIIAEVFLVSTPAHRCYFTYNMEYVFNNSWYQKHYSRFTKKNNELTVKYLIDLIGNNMANRSLKRNIILPADSKPLSIISISKERNSIFNEMMSAFKNYSVKCDEFIYVYYAYNSKE